MGILLLIPYISILMFFLMFVLSGIAVIVVLKRFNAVGILSIYDGCYIGAVAGFVSLICSAAVYLPFSLIFGGRLLMTGFDDIVVILMLVFFTAILSALFNAFSGLITAYIYEKIETRENISFNDHFELEIDRNEEI